MVLLAFQDCQVDQVGLVKRNFRRESSVREEAKRFVLVLVLILVLLHLLHVLILIHVKLDLAWR